MHRMLVFEPPPRKIGQSSHSDLVCFGKLCQGSKGSIHLHSFWSYDFFQDWNSIFFTFANQMPTAAQEMLSAHFLCVRKPYHALCLPLMEPCVNLLLLNICPPHSPQTSWNYQWAAPKSWKWVKGTFLQVKCLMFRWGGSESEVAEGEMQLYIGFDIEQTGFAIWQYKVELFNSSIRANYMVIYFN